MPSRSSSSAAFKRMDHAHAEGNNGDILAFAGDPRLADRNKKIVVRGHFEFVPIKDFVFEKNDRVRIADGALQKPLGVGRRIRHDDFEPRNMRIPRGIILAVLRGDARGGAIGAAKHDRTVHLAARHIARLGGGIDDLVHRLHREVEGHEFDDRAQACKGRAYTEPGKTMFGDRRIDHPAGAEFLQQPLRDFIGAFVFGDLFADDENAVVAAHLLGHRVAQGFAHGKCDHRRAVGNFRASFLRVRRGHLRRQLWLGAGFKSLRFLRAFA